MLAILLMIEAIAENEEERVFLEETFDKYSRLMFSVAYKYGLQRQDAEDVVMDSVLSIHKNITKIRALDVKKMPVYIVSIVGMHLWIFSERKNAEEWHSRMWRPMR